MKDVRRTCVSSTIALFLMLLFLTGCPKRPEVAETAPKPIGPQGAIAMPAPAPPSPPTVSAAPPTVPAPEEKFPPEVTTVPGEAGAAAEAKVPEVETPPASGEPSPEAQTTPEAGAAAEAQPTETEVMPGAQGKEAGVTPGTEGEVRGAEVSPPSGITSPSAGEPSTERVSPAPVEQVAPAPVPTPPSPPLAPPAVAEAAKAPELTVKDIYFDFDQALIRDDARKTLADNIQWFRANPAAKVTIEGHCDERGSSEYNLALGERRARVTRDSFVAAGIESSRISTISFGKERPFVLGHDETAWKWNRRAHFVLSTK